MRRLPPRSTQSRSSAASDVYKRQAIEMGFKSVFLAEILANLPGTEVNIALSDPSRVGLITPIYTEPENEELCALLMPMMITQ